MQCLARYLKKSSPPVVHGRAAYEDYCRLLHEDEFLHRSKVGGSVLAASHNAVEVNTAAHAGRVPLYLVCVRRFNSIHQRGDKPAKHVVNLQTDVRALREVILDHRCWVERI